MPTEIERKFLIDVDVIDFPQVGQLIRQGYIALTNKAVVRVRRYGDRGFLTIKGKTEGISRSEFEYEIPAHEADEILEGLCRKPLIEKRRYIIPFHEHQWEVDVFAGENDGLVVAEIELKSEDQKFERPPWLGHEVTQEFRYSNSNLVKNPFNSW